MSELVADCPRCGSRRITFDVTQEHKYAIHYSWQNCYEAFCICQHCRRSTVFFLHQDVNVDTIGKHGILKLDVSVNRFMRVEGFVNISNVATADPAEHVPEDIKATF